MIECNDHINQYAVVKMSILCVDDRLPVMSSWENNFFEGQRSLYAIEYGSYLRFEHDSAPS